MFSGVGGNCLGPAYTTRLWNHNPRVRGSNPCTGTILKHYAPRGCGFAPLGRFRVCLSWSSSGQHSDVCREHRQPSADDADTRRFATNRCLSPCRSKGSGPSTRTSEGITRDPSLDCSRICVCVCPRHLRTYPRLDSGHSPASCAYPKPTTTDPRLRRSNRVPAGAAVSHPWLQLPRVAQGVD